MDIAAGIRLLPPKETSSPVHRGEGEIDGGVAEGRSHGEVVRFLKPDDGRRLEKRTTLD